MARPVHAKPAAGECRLCRSTCDKLVDPRDCVALGCPYLYAYDDRATGQRYTGCMQKVFAAEVDLTLYARAPRGTGVKVSRAPLARCPFRVERAFAGTGDEFRCVNRPFLEPAAEERRNQASGPP
jgi:hypothetical protein